MNEWNGDKGTNIILTNNECDVRGERQRERGPYQHDDRDEACSSLQIRPTPPLSFAAIHRPFPEKWGGEGFPHHQRNHQVRMILGEMRREWGGEEEVCEIERD